MYPSDSLRKAYPLRNFEPLGDREPLQTVFRMKEPGDVDSIISTAMEYKGRRITFEDPNPVPQFVFDSSAVSTVDGYIYGGHLAQNHVFDGVTPTTMQFIAAARDGYHGTDFGTMAVTVPAYVREGLEVGFMVNVRDAWQDVHDFAHHDLGVVGVTAKGRKIYEGRVDDLEIWHWDDGVRAYEELKQLRRRLNSVPKVRLRAYFYDNGKMTGFKDRWVDDEKWFGSGLTSEEEARQRELRATFIRENRQFLRKRQRSA